MSESFNWTCPYCKTKTTIIIDTNYSEYIHFYDNTQSKYPKVGLMTNIIVCPNNECNELVILAHLYGAKRRTIYACDGLEIEGEPILSWTLKPEGSSIPLPEYIPEQIRNDYYEACKILTLSPKASATLARRCLQGMVRDFWGIQKSRLIDEINELKNVVDSGTYNAIDAIRSIGNIGAHMEKDVNLIIDIDQDEATMLIKLLEELFQDWYIEKYEKDLRHREIASLAASKSNKKA